MAKFWDAVVLMLFIYALAAVVSFFVAWVIKMIFVVIQWRNARAAARAEVQAEATAGTETATPKGTN